MQGCGALFAIALFFSLWGNPLAVAVGCGLCLIAEAIGALADALDQ